MKRNFLLLATLMVLGTGTMMAKTLATNESSVLTIQTEEVTNQYTITFYDIVTDELVYEEVACVTGQEALDMADAIAEDLGGYDKVYGYVRLDGACEL
ncbi:hypothetical protein [Myroides odoratus]|uniref:Uncharacterized protein n=1 Tax=Myroides odoratus TaxID=256 RepID=A0A378RKZ4_MYROD|nr:hypothetical protein [Myroides odoratus]QQU05129.1 hypothetical protein I6I89_07565 [Myroides odoratus]STZ27388.1 Uncharacterised protein [Myroides odoratus]